MAENQPGGIDLNMLRNTVTGQEISTPEPKLPWYERWVVADLRDYLQEFLGRRKHPSLENLRAAARQNTENPEDNK